MADANGTNGNGRWKVEQGTVLQLVMLAVAAFMAYSAINARVAVVESQMQQFRGDLTEIKSDVKSLLRRP